MTREDGWDEKLEWLYMEELGRKMLLLCSACLPDTMGDWWLVMCTVFMWHGQTPGLLVLLTLSVWPLKRKEISCDETWQLPVKRQPYDFDKPKVRERKEKVVQLPGNQTPRLLTHFTGQSTSYHALPKVNCVVWEKSSMTENRPWQHKL